MNWVDTSASSVSEMLFGLISEDEEFSGFFIEEVESVFSEEPWKVFLAIETIRYLFACICVHLRQ